MMMIIYSGTMMYLALSVLSCPPIEIISRQWFDLGDAHTFFVLHITAIVVPCCANAMSTSKSHIKSIWNKTQWVVDFTMYLEDYDKKILIF